MLVSVMKMRADTCRHCGYELEALKKCIVCGKPYQFQCKSCGQESEEQIHPECIKWCCRACFI